MAVHNEERYVGKAIESILRQSYQTFEFLIINDGSTDKSREIICSHQDPRIRLVDNPNNVGLTKSLNRGLELARGALIARFDGNDISRPDRLAKQVAFMSANPDVAVVGGQVRAIDVNGRRLRGVFLRKPVTELGIQWYLMFGSPISHPTATFRRNVVWNELHGYDESWAVGQDAELWSRVAERHSIANMSDVVVDFRLDPASISGSGNLSSPRRAGHTVRMERLFRRNMSRYLKCERIPAEWSDMAVRQLFPSLSVDRSVGCRLRRTIYCVLSRFAQVSPDVESNREVTQHIADMLYRVALELVRSNRKDALKSFLAACRKEPARAAAWSPKFVALFVLGEAARRRWRRWRYG